MATVATLTIFVLPRWSGEDCLPITVGIYHGIRVDPCQVFHNHLPTAFPAQSERQFVRAPGPVVMPIAHCPVAMPTPHERLGKLGGSCC